jgi:hypothetical protein
MTAGAGRRAGNAATVTVTDAGKTPKGSRLAWDISGVKTHEE